MNPLSDDAVQRLQKIVSEPDLSGTKYSLIRKIGSGGMAEVYLVFDEQLEREAALKVIHPAHSADDLPERMMREAKVNAQMEHPSIVPVHDAGVLPDGRNFYVMKYVQGESLDFYSPRVSLKDRLAILQKICDAVSFAHSRGVIHRDLKPQNVMVGTFGEVQVMDWGLAKLLRAPVAKPPGENRHRGAFQTDAGTVLGTPEYMPPEQERGSTTILDERSDIYALGAILYYLLTLAPPSRSIRPRDQNPAVPKRLEAVCRKAMSEMPEARYDSAQELSRDISAYLNRMPMVAYRENVFEKIGRWVSRNSFVALLVLAYLVMRAILYFIFR
jgi:serine/threonine protein kinase